MTEKKVDVAKYYGPGLWYSLHLDASDIMTGEDEDYFIKRLYRLCKGHPCGNCSNHCQKYLKDNNPESYKGVFDDKGNRIGLSKYVWAFHNFVNARLGKEQMSWDTYFSLFYLNKKSVCSEECGEEKIVDELSKIAGTNPFIKVVKK